MTDMTAEQALDAVSNVLERAYDNAEPVCCGMSGSECCGSPEPEWSEYDKQIMNDLQPVAQYLSQALSQRVPEVWSESAPRATIAPDSPEEWQLETRAFQIANDNSTPEYARSLIRDLWWHFVDREPAQSADSDKDAEIARFREDAERYRWLRDRITVTEVQAMEVRDPEEDAMPYSVEVDAAIDAARQRDGG